MNESSPAVRRHLRVVGALIEREGYILLTRRMEGRALAGRWEFPGGKVHERETDEAALARELKEELGIDARIGAWFQTVEHDYPDFRITLVVYRGALGAEEPRCIEVAEIAWVRPAALLDYDLTPPDVPVAERLRNGAASRLLSP